jgi:hypothetical protein
MSDRRTGEDRRVEDIPVEEERRSEERRGDDRSRRQVMDRRVSTVAVEFADRRMSSRRVAEQDPNSEAAPDWMEGALKEASERSAAFTPPQVDINENEFLSFSDSEILKRQMIWDSIIMGFVLICFIALIAIIFLGL